MRLAVIGRWLIGLGPETVAYSRLSQREIVRRAEQGVAENRAERKSRSLGGVLAAAQKGIGSVDGDWDTERLSLWLRRSGQSTGMLPTLRVTFAAADNGTRVTLRAKYILFATIFLFLWSAVCVYLMTTGAGNIVPDVPGWLLGSVLLIFGLASAAAERRRESLDIAVLDEFLSRCADLHSSYEPGEAGETGLTR